MAIKSKRIKGKLLWEAYAPSEADADEYSDGEKFSAIVGNKRFHSFQVWRETAGGRATCIYGLTLNQIEKISSQADERLVAENAALKKQIEDHQAVVPTTGNSSAIAETEPYRPTLAEMNMQLREENQWFKQALRSKTNGTAEFRAIPIPMGGAPGYKLKQKRR